MLILFDSDGIIALRRIALRYLNLIYRDRAFRIFSSAYHLL